MSNGLPPIQSALLPEDVRKAGPKAERMYQTALAFESVLIRQLTQSLGSTLESVRLPVNRMSSPLNTIRSA